MARKAISKKLRFEVFKRDSFSCQYCGRSSPDVVLNVDHVNPVSKGGKNDILNLITSCFECNNGKGARELSDDSILARQQEQLAQLSEKREQLAMMIKWRDGLQDIDKMKVEEAVAKYHAAAIGWKLNDNGLSKFRKWVKEFPFDILLDSIEVSQAKLAFGEDGKATDGSATEFLNYIPRVASCKLRDRKDPGLGELMRLRGRMRAWMSFRDWECLNFLKEARDCGISTEELQSIASSSSSWYRFQESVRDRIVR